MIKAVTYYEAFCDNCGERNDNGDYTAWGDDGVALESAIDYDWFYRAEPERLLCLNCQKCEVCDAPGYPLDDHIVCQDHEGASLGVVETEAS